MCSTRWRHSEPERASRCLMKLRELGTLLLVYWTETWATRRPTTRIPSLVEPTSGSGRNTTNSCQSKDGHGEGLYQKCLPVRPPKSYTQTPRYGTRFASYVRRRLHITFEHILRSPMSGSRRSLAFFSCWIEACGEWSTIADTCAHVCSSYSISSTPCFTWKCLHLQTVPRQYQRQLPKASSRPILSSCSHSVSLRYIELHG